MQSHPHCVSVRGNIKAAEKCEWNGSTPRVLEMIAAENGQFKSGQPAHSFKREQNMNFYKQLIPSKFVYKIVMAILLLLIE